MLTNEQMRDHSLDTIEHHCNTLTHEADMDERILSLVILLGTNAKILLHSIGPERTLESLQTCIDEINKGIN